MKFIAWIVAALIITTGGWYYFSMQSPAPIENQPADVSQDAAQAALQPTVSTSTASKPQQAERLPIMAWTPEPGGDGYIEPIVGKNLTLGLDGTGTTSHLIGYTGRTLYTFDNDTAGRATCAGTCATKWPPYIVSPVDYINQVKSGIDASKVGTTTAPAGYTDPSGFIIQLTYAGKPLYFYAEDKNGSDALGDGKGGVWHIVRP